MFQTLKVQNNLKSDNKENIFNQYSAWYFKLLQTFCCACIEDVKQSLYFKNV